MQGPKSSFIQTPNIDEAPFKQCSKKVFANLDNLNRNQIQDALKDNKGTDEITVPKLDKRQSKVGHELESIVKT